MNFLVIGAGGAGSIHTQELLSRGFRVGVYDRDPAKARALAGRTDAIIAQSDEGSYDCAVVAVPANAHFEVVQRQIALGRRAVVCEKPLCLRPHEAETVTEVAATSTTNLLIAESQCYSEDDGLGVARMRDRVQAGEFGQPVLWRVCAMTSYRPQAWFDDLRVGGGAFIEGGVHVLTAARVLFGEAVRWQGSVRCFSGGTGPDSGTFLIDYADGHQLTLQIGWGTEGCFTGECKPLPNSAGLFGPRRCEAWWPGDNHSAMWDHLLRCIQGEVNPVATLAHAVGAVYDAWECYRAAGVLK